MSATAGGADLDAGDEAVRLWKLHFCLLRQDLASNSRFWIPRKVLKVAWNRSLRDSDIIGPGTVLLPASLERHLAVRSTER
jgi:hypothetical protein